MQDAETNLNSYRLLGPWKHELLWEGLILCGGAFLGFSLTTKLTVATTLASLKFAFPHCVTGYLVWRQQPDGPGHRALLLLFTALGLARASVASLIFIGLFLLGIAISGPQQPWFGLLLSQFSTAVLLTLFYLLLIFPLVAFGCYLSTPLPVPPLFLSQLTHLRRQHFRNSDAVELKPQEGWQTLARASTFSLALWIFGLTFGLSSWLALNHVVWFKTWGVACGLLNVLINFSLPILWFLFFQLRFVGVQPERI